MSFLTKAVVLLLVAAMVLSYAKAEVVELTPANFNAIVRDRSKNVFVMFYAPWCGHCNHMKPAWQDLGAKYPGGASDIVIARVDGSAHRGIAKEHDIHGFPTLKLFTKSDKSGKQYAGPREVAALEAYLKQHAQ